MCKRTKTSKEVFVLFFVIENIYKRGTVIEYMNLRDKAKYDTIIILSDICKMEGKRWKWRIKFVKIS